MSGLTLHPMDEIVAETDRAAGRLLAPLDTLESRSPHVWSRLLPTFELFHRQFNLRRYVFLGTSSRHPTRLTRLGIFSAIHGDEIEGPLAIGRFLGELVQRPAEAKGIFLHCYPICNPTGLEDCTRHNRNGIDLDQEFWRQSSQPEVRILETEIKRRAFHGIISLHAPASARKFCGLINPEPESAKLLQVALRAAEVFLPVRFHQNGERAFVQPGMLQGPPGFQPRPFEIALLSPRSAPLHLQIEAFTAALRAILAEIRHSDAQQIAPIESPSIR